MAGKGLFGLPFFTLTPHPAVVSCVLSGGGSRASFQLGALAYLYEHDEHFTPSIFVGASAGSIIAAALAQGTTPEGQRAYLQSLTEIWDSMTTQADMFIMRPWFATLESEVPSWLELMRPARPVRPDPPRNAWLPFRRVAPPSTDEVELDPLELALAPDPVTPEHSDWSLAALSGIATHLSQLPRIGSGINSIAHGLENTRSMYRPGPVLARLLDDEVFSPSRAAASGNTLRLAMVALESGQLRYMTERGTLVDRVNEPYDDTERDLSVGVLASCSIPAVFRPVPLGDETYVDGGARENLPAELAIGHLGAARNYVISSQSSGVARRASMADADIFSVVMRSTEILIDEAGRDELAYAHSTGAVVVYPELSVHDAMTVDPGLIAINEAYGWMRAAEQHRALDEYVEARHRLIIQLRMRGLQVEKDYLGNPAPTRRDLITLHSVKVELRDAIRSAHGSPLPLGADSWWRRWEKHAVDPTTAPPWLDM